MLRVLITTVGAALVLLVAAACGGGDSKTFDTGDGEVTIGDDLPGDFPDDFPIYDDADLQSAAQGEQDGIEGIVATWTTGDDFDDVTAFYDEAFADGPWKKTTEGNAGGSSYWGVENTESGDVGYVAVTDGDNVAIVATVGDDPSQAVSDGDDDGDDGDSSSDDGSEDSDDGSDGSDDGSDGSDFPGATLPDEVDLPSNFPNDVPLIDDLHVASANTVNTGGIEIVSVIAYSKESADEVAAFYKRELEGKGFTQVIQTSDENGIYASYSENADGTGRLVVVTASDGDVEGYQSVVLQVSTPS